MKLQTASKGGTGRRKAARWVGHSIIGAAVLAGTTVFAADTTNEVENAVAPEKVEPADTTDQAATSEPLNESKLIEKQAKMFEGGEETYKNWVEVSGGSLMTSGSKSEAQARTQLKKATFGGIEDAHFQTVVATNTVLTIDGRAIYDNDDYKFDVGLVKEELGFVRFNYEQFRTWYNGNGGYYEPTNVWYPLSNSPLGLDRGEISVEAGLTLKDIPKLTFKYTHAYRDGQKNSTIWGQSHPDSTTLVRGLSPSYYDIDETRDIFELDATHKIKSTDVGLGVRYETGDFKDTLKITQWPGETVQRKITDKQGTTYDMFSAHGFTETWLKKDLFLSTGYQFVTMDGNYSGNRIYGDDFNVTQSPNALNGLGYTNLSGNFCRQEYLANVNLMAMPWKNLTIVPSLRVSKVDWNADSVGYQTLGTSAATYAPSDADGGSLDVTEQLDIRYTGITNWVFYMSGQWTEGNGDLNEDGGIGTTAPIQRDTDDCRFFQKYSGGVRWYPLRLMKVDVGGYYKRNQYNYDNTQDSTLNSTNSGNRYPAYMVMQRFETLDGFARLTLRPHQKVTLITRYEYQQTKIYTDPDSDSGLGDEQSGKITGHILGQNISWTPWSRLYLQTGFNYVFSRTETPASDDFSSVPDSNNGYWTVNFNSGFVVDDRTDLDVGSFYYKANNDNKANGVDWGADSEAYGVTAGILRRISKNMRLSFRYAYMHNDDDASGGHNNFESHTLFSSLQYRF